MEQCRQRLLLLFNLLMKINRLKFHFITKKYYFASSLTALKLKWHQLTKLPFTDTYDEYTQQRNSHHSFSTARNSVEININTLTLPKIIRVALTL
ncbi:hypothetical protein Dda3937_04509 [Dickeya dadantii 3937]|uniref:Uncharacterized protein n=1 Tax=Dickeya dadantii (strain 3937) TaxID=198628 RepID=E0SFW6_DICD3|nr:hypothetical protein Dda3937_04509 [Dickeya dadantii 3937]